ncbi:hypothetical protein AB8O38_09845 [Saccharomonospora xinjiangensis]|uniref:hypothetical protein n=1 Tax=Saccharomonospora xinjiangensis TaxID=75294 RepID=UPI00350FBFDD
MADLLGAGHESSGREFGEPCERSARWGRGRGWGSRCSARADDIYGRTPVSLAASPIATCALCHATPVLVQDRPVGRHPELGCLPLGSQPIVEV